MIRLKVKGKEYFPVRINNFNKYRAKLLSFLGRNQNLFLEGVKETSSGIFGILVKGKDIENIRDNLELSPIWDTAIKKYILIGCGYKDE
ncbi:hypothetical protein LCGC14_2933210 [marine sediment metagenome]|uniref:Uncharacterized protein n=1 Tax=marine sediment metagenome TaxID=412755 RepID=A0A0F9ABA8_9ZZZZ